MYKPHGEEGLRLQTDFQLLLHWLLVSFVRYHSCQVCHHTEAHLTGDYINAHCYNVILCGLIFQRLT